MKKVFRILIGVLIVALFVGTLWFLYQKSQEKPVTYDTKQAEYNTIVKKTVATGSIVPRKEVEIKPKVSGIIYKLYVEEGDVVKAGDIIAKVQVIPDMLSLNNAETRLTNARINLDQQKQEFDRQKALFDKKVIPQSEFLLAKSAYSRAKAELDAAENNLQLIKEGASKRSGKTTNTLVRSTISGMVLEVPVEVGNSVIESNTFNAGTTIAFVANMSDMIFKGKVDESEVGKLKQGMDLVLSVGAIVDAKFDAALEHIAPKGKIENGAIQFEIKAKVKLKEDEFIRAGYSANADIVLDKRDSVLTLDEGLIDFRADSAFVEVETGEQEFEERYIKTGLSDGINIEILEGISSDDKLKVRNTSQKDKNKDKKEEEH
jgi:HlyD family secretion protein